MTAPLIISKEDKLETSTSRTTVYQLLDAIDKNNIEQVETSMSKIFKTNVPEISMQQFYNYAQAKQKKDVCEYFKLILVATYNTSI